MNNEQEVLKDTPTTNTEKKLSIKPRYIIYIFVIILLAICLILIPSKSIELFKDNKGKIEKLCNLATIEAIYHNVEIVENEGLFGDTFGGIINLGYKKYWREYEGTIKFGINAKDVTIEKPNNKGVIKIHLPKATILGEPNVIKESMKDPITDTGLLTTITNEERIQAFVNAQNNMKENAAKDEEMLSLAEEKAKKYFENYFVELGQLIGKKYTVEFVD